jgi:hypothetical protein
MEGVIEKVILELQFILFAVMTEDKAFMLKSNFISSHTLFRMRTYLFRY